MAHWTSAVSLIGILSIAVVWGTDMFFLTVGRTALRSASASAATEVMGFIHMYADARMPIFGALAISSNILLAVLSSGQERWFYGVSLLTVFIFLAVYNGLSKPINRLQTEAARAGQSLDNARELQASWDRSLFLRAPLLATSLTAQCAALLFSASHF